MKSDNDNLPMLLRIGDVEKMVGLGRSSIYRNMNAGKFPEPLALGTGAVRWRYSDIAAWVDGLQQARAA